MPCVLWADGRPLLRARVSWCVRSCAYLAWRPWCGCAGQVRHRRRHQRQHRHRQPTAQVRRRVHQRAWGACRQLRQPQLELTRMSVHPHPLLRCCLAAASRFDLVLVLLDTMNQEVRPRRVVVLPSSMAAAAALSPERVRVVMMARLHAPLRSGMRWCHRSSCRARVEPETWTPRRQQSQTATTWARCGRWPSCRLTCPTSRCARARLAAVLCSCARAPVCAEHGVRAARIASCHGLARD